MYQKAKNSWIKHIDFVILDILCLQVSFFLAYLVRHRNLNLRLPLRESSGKRCH